jgi:pimeloyl-ACP methyl ester carboxylesterase
MSQPWGLLLLFALAIFMLCVWGGALTALQALRPPRKFFAWALATGRPKDPADIGLAFEDTQYSCGQYFPCPAWRITAKSTHPNAPILVVIHGWGRSRWDSLTRVDPFLDACCEMVLLDLPAHGEHASTWSALGIHEPTCVLNVLQEIARQSPGKNIILAGHSMGAGIAIRAANLAAQHMVELPANTLKNQAKPKPAPIETNTQSSQATINQAAPQQATSSQSVRVVGVIAFAPYQTLRSPIPARLRLKNLPRWPLAPIAFLILRILNRMDQPLSMDARELRAPLLVMTGDHDPISPAVDAQKICQAAPRSTLIVLPYSRHDNLREGNAEKFDSAIAKFLQDITA